MTRNVVVMDELEPDGPPRSRNAILSELRRCAEEHLSVDSLEWAKVIFHKVWAEGQLSLGW